ncbi:MAG: type II toxin-antitoxin system HicB family antitoxin [Candidatus Altiarchaeota archaeon]
MNFKVVLEKGEDDYIVARVPSIPGCISQGKSEKDALKNIKEAISLHIDCLAEDGIPCSG